jgi:hypothetical protein
VAIAELYSGSETVSTTEHSLTTDSSGPDVDTTDGVFQLWIDVSDMVKADILQVRMYEKVTSGGTQRVAWEVRLANAQTEPIWVSPSFILLHGWDFTLDAIAGTIDVTWSIRQVA